MVMVMTLFILAIVTVLHHGMRPCSHTLETCWWGEKESVRLRHLLKRESQIYPKEYTKQAIRLCSLYSHLNSAFSTRSRTSSIYYCLGQSKQCTHVLQPSRNRHFILSLRSEYIGCMQLGCVWHVSISMWMLLHTQGDLARCSLQGLQFQCAGTRSRRILASPQEGGLPSELCDVYHGSYRVYVLQSGMTYTVSWDHIEGKCT